MDNIGKEIATNFRKFLHSQEADPYEVAVWCYNLIKYDIQKITGKFPSDAPFVYHGNIEDYDLKLDED